MGNVKYLGVEHILLVHAYEINLYGGNPDLLNLELLESAIYRPKTSLGDQKKYKTIFEKAAALTIALIKKSSFRRWK